VVLQQKVVEKRDLPKVKVVEQKKVEELPKVKKVEVEKDLNSNKITF
jgi:hypothetical protein